MQSVDNPGQLALVSPPAVDGPSAPNVADPRVLLADWANNADEWVRFLAADVIATGRAVSGSVVDESYALFRQEKALDGRTVSAVERLSVASSAEEAAVPLSIVRVSAVSGVNALVPGERIEPNAGLTILYGENGTGKTGYSRIFKALADSRTADEILGNIESENVDTPKATIEYELAGQAKTLSWAGERGVAPFTRMSIFDSPAVTFHVDDDLEYVYVPAALALFGHLITAIQQVQAKIDGQISELSIGGTTLLSRFPRESSVYPVIEALGAATDLADLKAQADADPNVDARIDALRQAVAALQANSMSSQITLRQREQRVLERAVAVLATLQTFDLAAYIATLNREAELSHDYETFRNELFAAASLPAEPDETWSVFISAGDAYRSHLESLGVQDDQRCLYCRQEVDEVARSLIQKYTAYLEDGIRSELTAVEAQLTQYEQAVAAANSAEIVAYVDEHGSQGEHPEFLNAIQAIATRHQALIAATAARVAPDLDIDSVSSAIQVVPSALAATSATLASLQQQAANRESTLVEKRAELTELVAAAELARSWQVIEKRVTDAKEADKLKLLRRALPQLARSVTELSKTASDQLINQSFDALFLEECEALRAPLLKVQFVGREGKAQRRKVMSGQHRPSKVLSEGEQKVLAMADFLAEARLAGITAPVIFDDPVSSLDHRRIKEVATRVANLAHQNQVIVFTHDIYFASTLLAIFEKSTRCSYFQITDEEGKGKITRATGPRWDSLGNLKRNINKTIDNAKQQDGDVRTALVQTGYDWIRAWCEVFTETKVLQGVTQRYQPNVRMGMLTEIKVDKLPQTIEVVNRVFEDACRYIDGHSQPLPTLGVSPTLSGLEAHWKELQACAKEYDA